MKYIVDIDALKDCLGLLPTSYSDIGYVDLNDVMKMIDRFPKEKVEDNTKDRINLFEMCRDCSNYGWDMPLCKECSAANNFKYFIRK